MRTKLLSLAALLLAGCAVGPNYAPPVTPASSAGPLIGSRFPAVSTADVPGDWWTLYDDPVLDGLIVDALKANTDIRVAVAHLEKARAALRGARADTLPQGSLDASGGYRRLPQMQALPGADRETGLVDGSVSVAYEIDLFGRVKRSIEAARGDVGLCENARATREARYRARPGQ